MDGGRWWLRKSEVMGGKILLVTTDAVHFPAKSFWASFNLEVESPTYPSTLSVGNKYNTPI
jgi:hypothetical protein